MKFTAFHLMPFDGLSEDFPEKHRSVWVDIPPDVMDVKRMHVLYNDYLDELEFAARSGFHAIGVNEHHSSGYGTMSSPNMMATSLARRTADTAAKLLVMGDAVPLYNPPIRIAEELAMLDVISGGRLITGFPLGSSQDSNFAYGIPPATTREQHREGFDLILKAWQSREVFTHNGDYSKLRYVNPWPKPLQKPHPPIWIPGSGSVETMDFALERDFPFFFLSYFGADYAENMLKKFWERAEIAGRDDNPYRVGMFRRTVDAWQALDLGLVNRVVPAQRTVAAAVALAQEVASMAPLAAQNATEALDQIDESPMTAAMDHDRALMSLLLSTRDATEGLTAFVERRRPNFEGR